MNADQPQTEPTAENAPKSPDRAGGNVGRIVAVVFFALLAAHIVFNVTPRVLYGADEIAPGGKTIPLFPIYYSGAEFFKPFLSEAGGMAEYLGANLSQYFAARYGGEIILIAFAFIAFLLTDGLVGAMGGRKGNVARLLVPLMLVLVWNRYTFVLADQVSLLVALLAAVAYMRLPDKAAIRAVIMVPGILAFYCVAGAPAILLAAICGLYELIAKRRVDGGIYLIVGAVAPGALGVLVFDLSLPESYLVRAGMSGGATAATAMCALYVFVILLAAGLAYRRRLEDDTPQEPSADAPPPGAMKMAVGPLVVVVVAVAMGLLTHDRDLRAFRKVCFASQAGASGATIVAISEYPPELYTADTCHMLNRALYAEGDLGRIMFAFPQSPEGGLIPLPNPNQPYKSDTLLQLGAVDAAEDLARDSLETWGPRPFVVKLLAKIAIVKKDWPTAEEHLTMLAGDIVHGIEAKEYLDRLAQGDDFKDDPEISRIRNNWLVGYRYQPHGAQQLLENLLLRKNMKNQMAYEYLMAHYLLTLQVPEFAKRIGHLKTFNYDFMPTQFAEAMILFLAQTDQMGALEGLELDMQAQERRQRFLALLRQHREDPMTLAETVAMEMPASYLGYYFAAVQQLAQRQNAPQGGQPRP